MKETDIDDHALTPGDVTEPGTPATGENLCPDCGGSGIARSGETCPACEGSGQLVQGAGGG